ncbi:hypothetical protein NHX12_006237 [Muraenolepis orangiensis]|uniref:Uncharacterized protein n=1 Tax=Muraenolepis orangiensis TaxID=630683 RepID=A0A9Q0ICN6_9TELE|nr:hypothetical protein NHX12_006237 [Muraenolepis orangiensis]
MADFHVQPESVRGEEAGVARFQCQVHGLPEPLISWEKNGRPITGLGPEDAGRFCCVAHNSAAVKHSTEARLTVSGSRSSVYKEPVILVGPENLTLTVHQTAILECVATGYPKPIVSWSRLDHRRRMRRFSLIRAAQTGFSEDKEKNPLPGCQYLICVTWESNTRESTSVPPTNPGPGSDAPPRDTWWSKSIARPVGTTAIFSCQAQGQPIPQLTWLKNGQILEPGGHVKLRNNNSTLTMYGISQDDDAIYQCIAENSAGSTQASARLTVLWADGLPGAPTQVMARALSPSAIQVSWNQPRQNTQDIIGYVLHIRRSSVPAPPSLSTRLLNSSVVQAVWEPSTKMGPHSGFRLFFRRTHAPLFTGPFLFPRNASHYNISQLDPSLVYEIKLLAFNQHGDSNATVRFVSLRETVEKSVLNTPCDCAKDDHARTSTAGIIIGIHIGITCIVLCVVFLVVSYRGRLMMFKAVQATPQAGRASVLESSSSQGAAGQMSVPCRREVEVNGSTSRKSFHESNELQRLFSSGPKPEDMFLSENNTQLSTIPLDEFSLERDTETQFQQPPAEGVPRQDQG